MHACIHTYIRDSRLWAIFKLAGEAAESRHFPGGQVHPRVAGEGQPLLRGAAATGEHVCTIDTTDTTDTTHVLSIFESVYYIL